MSDRREIDCLKLQKLFIKPCYRWSKLKSFAWNLFIINGLYHGDQTATIKFSKSWIVRKYWQFTKVVHVEIIVYLIYLWLDNFSWFTQKIKWYLNIFCDKIRLTLLEDHWLLILTNVAMPLIKWRMHFKCRGSEWLNMLPENEVCTRIRQFKVQYLLSYGYNLKIVIILSSRVIFIILIYFIVTSCVLIVNNIICE